MANNKDIYVSFGADVSDLNAAMALAKANIESMSADLRNLAKDMISVGTAADANLTKSVKTISGDLEGMTAGTANYGEQLKTFAGDMEATGAAALRGHVGLSFYTRETRALLDELTSGRDRQAMGTLANLAGTFLQANTDMIPLVAAATALAGSFAYLEYEAASAAKGIHSIELDAVVAQFRLTDGEAQKLMTSIADVANVSNATAAEIAKPFLALGEGGDLVAKIASQYLPLLADQMGEKMPKAAEKLAANFADLEKKGRAYITETEGVTAAQVAAYDAFVASGQTGQAYLVILDAMKSRLAAYSAEVQRKAAAERDAAAATLDASRAYAGMEGVLIDLGGHLDETNAKLRDQAAAAKQDEAALVSVQHAQAAFAEGMTTALKIDKITSDIRKTTTELNKMRAALQNLPAGDATAGTELALGISEAEDRLKELQQKAGDGLLGRDVLARTKEQISELNDTFRGSTVDRLKAERDLLAGMTSSDALTASQRHQIEVDLAAKDREIRDASNRAFLAGEDMKATAAALSKVKVIAVREEEVAHEIAIYGEGSDQAIAAEKRLADAKEAAARKTAGLAATSARQDLAALRDGYSEQIRAAEEMAQTKIQIAELELGGHRITEQQKLTTTLQALTQERAAVDAAYAAELQLAGLTADTIKKIRDQQTLFDLKNLDEMTKANARAAEQSAAAWKSYADTSAGLVNSQVDGLLKGTTSIAQAFKNMAASAIEDIIKLCVKWAAEHAATVLMNITGLAAETAATAAAATAQAGSMASGHAAERALNQQSITGDAGRAAAGAYAATASIPIVGPMLAPAAAAAAFAGVETFGSFANGAMNVPADMLALIHAGERIIPAGPPAAAVDAVLGRNGSANAAGNGGGGITGGTTHNWNFTGATILDKTALVRLVVEQMNNNPSLRPRY